MNFRYLKQATRVALSGMLAMLLSSQIFATESAQLVTEYRIKAAFLYNFSRFTSWPEQAIPDNGNFTVCVLGKDPFGESLDSLAGKKVNNNSLAVGRFTSLDKIEGCQLVYVNLPKKDLKKAMSVLKQHPILTVSDMDSFTDAGGIIRFKLVNNKVRFDINIDAARTANLSISSKLLSLATIVRGNK